MLKIINLMLNTSKISIIKIVYLEPFAKEASGRGTRCARVRLVNHRFLRAIVQFGVRS